MAHNRNTSEDNKCTMLKWQQDRVHDDILLLSELTSSPSVSLFGEVLSIDN